MVNGTAGIVSDVWQGEVFCNMRDTHSEGQRRDLPFFPGPEGDLRLAFSFSVDGFHPFHGKPAGLNATSTGIWLVLLNLPPHLRYLPQNVYLAGVIPGPHKPSNDQINHYIQLIVNDFQELFHPGIFFSRTHDSRKGRRCRGMLIPVVCDLLGAHQAVGYPGAPTAHYFCTCCELDIDDINIIDTMEWPKKDIQHIRRFAQLYRDAQTEADQKSIFNGCGWRWSPLFELEYWNPSIFTVVDSMHAIDLHLFKNQVHGLFQIDPSHRRGEALRPPTMDRVKRVVAVKSEVRALKKCQDLIYENPPKLIYQLLMVHRKVLYSFCLDYDIRLDGQNLVTGTRWILAKAIHLWVCFLYFSLTCERALIDWSMQRQQRDSESVKAFLKRYPLVSPAQQTLIEESATNAAEEDDVVSDDQNGGEAPSPGSPDELSDAGTPPREPMHRRELDDDDTEGQPTAAVVRASVKVSVLKRHALKLVDFVESGGDEDKPIYDKITVAILVHFCDILALDRAQIEKTTRKSEKRKLFDFILHQVCIN